MCSALIAGASVLVTGCSGGVGDGPSGSAVGAFPTSASSAVTPAAPVVAAPSPPSAGEPSVAPPGAGEPSVAPPGVGEPSVVPPGVVEPSVVPAEPTSPTPPATVNACASPVSPGEPVFARLTSLEYSATAKELTGAEDAGDFIRTIKTAGFISTTATLTDQAELNAYVVAAERLAAAALENRPELADTARFSDETFVRAFAESFGAEAFRRPLAPSEVDRYLEAYRGGAAFSPVEGMRWLLSSLLASPHFIYRVERGQTNPTLPDGVRQLTSWETASRLSYFFVGSSPDADLRVAALNNALGTEEQILEQARRLVDSPLGRQRMTRFIAEWLGIEDIDPAITDRLNRFDPARPEVPLALRESLRALVEHIAYAQEGTLEDLLRTPLVFANETLAQSWGLGEFSGASTTLPQEHRLGVLTHPAFLSIHATTSFASASLRGGFIAEHVMCTPVPEPDANVFAQFPEINERSVTNRATLEQEHMVPGCVGCHRVIDPLGFAFENFDAGGRFVTTEQHGAHPQTAIDASGEVVLDGAVHPYSNATEFVELLSGSPAVQACVSRHLLRFALHRWDAATDSCTLQQLSNHLRDGSGKLTELFAGFAATDAFRYLAVTTTEGTPE